MKQQTSCKWLFSFLFLDYWTQLVLWIGFVPHLGLGNLQGDQCECVSRLLPLSWWPPCWQENIDSQRPSYSRAQLRRALGYRVGCKTRKYRGQSMALVHTTILVSFWPTLMAGWLGIHTCINVHHRNYIFCVFIVSVTVTVW